VKKVYARLKRRWRKFRLFERNLRWSIRKAIFLFTWHRIVAPLYWRYYNALPRYGVNASEFLNAITLDSPLTGIALDRYAGDGRHRR